jgi:hypothetical protein
MQKIRMSIQKSMSRSKKIGKNTNTQKILLTRIKTHANNGDFQSVANDFGNFANRQGAIFCIAHVLTNKNWLVLKCTIQTLLPLLGQRIST